MYPIILLLKRVKKHFTMYCCFIFFCMIWHLWCSICKFRNNKGDTLAASYYHQVHGTTAVGAEIAHTFSSNENTLTIGSQHELDPLTTVKARFNNFGIASALLQHAWRPKSLITFSTEIDTKAIEKSPKFGLALSLKP
jgi:voltage-dependent anion channel protein 2